MSQAPVGKFYDNLNLSFSLGRVRCYALKLSFEHCLRSFPSHSHSNNSWEIHYIAYGKGHITLNGEAREVAAGNFFLTGPQVEHSQIPDPEDPMTEYCIYMRFDPKAPDLKHGKNPSFLDQFLNTPSFFGWDTQNIHVLMQNLFHELDAKNTGYITQITALLTQLLVFSVRNFEQEREPAGIFEISSLSDRSYLIIEECFLYEYSTLSLDTLALRLGLSPRQTERLLKDHYGKTFQQKKAEAKMSAATILLKEKDKSITDISLALGYSSVEHFSTAFRRYYGLSASAWRTQKLKESAPLPFA